MSVVQIMANTLGLDDDLEPVEVLQDVEAAFSVRVTDAEAFECVTVGDIYGILRGRFSTSKESAGRCATAMTFYRLRRALADLSTDAGIIHSDTQVESLTPLTAKALVKQIGASSGLRLPRPRSTQLGVTGGCLIFAGLVSLFAPAVFGPYWWPVPTVIVAVGIILVRLDPKQIPPDCQTVGELSRKVAGINFGNLVAEGAEPRDSHLWTALIEVLSEHTLLPKSEIQPETVLLQSQFRSA